MCLALARTVATKVVLRSGQQETQGSQNDHQWDHVFRQTGLVGSAIVFHNGDATNAIQSLPPKQFNDALAVTFCTQLQEAQDQQEGQAAVRRIAQFQLDKALFVDQANCLRDTNPVYAEGVTEINRDLLTEWVDQQVPQPILDCVLTVPVGEGGPGVMRQEGPASATEQRTTPDEDPVIFAMESEVSDFNSKRLDLSNRIVVLLQKLEELEAAGARSVALEMEALVEDEGSQWVDQAGRKRILELCNEIHESCEKVSHAGMRTKLEEELRDIVEGRSRWLLKSETNSNGEPSLAEVDVTTASGVGAEVDVTMASRERSGQVDRSGPGHLVVARGKKPLSLLDWKIWTMARPRLWRYGDAANLYPDREVPLATREWAACLLLREELEYSLSDDVHESPVQNRFSGDWVALHMIATVSRLTDQHAATYNFLKNGGMVFAKTLRGLSAEKLAQAARVSKDAGASLQQLHTTPGIPREVKDALRAMNGASSAVLGTDGHRQFCRHEGCAYMETFGPPLIFVTPNVADTQHPLLLIVQGEQIDLGAVSADTASTLPKYRDMLRRVAQDPVGQVVQFEMLMRLFLQHVLNVRPETLDCRRNSVRAACREWCSDGVAAASSGSGMVGPVLAFRGEIEAQGRGSLHPHILVWLVCGHLEVLSQLTEVLRTKQQELRQRLKEFMQLAVASFESISHASVQAAPRCAGSDVLDAPVKITEVARNLFRGDGGSDKELLEQLKEKTPEQEEYLLWISEEDWRRPKFQVEATTTGKQSIFATPINQLSVASTPKYRLRSLLCDPHVPELDADAWRTAFQQDLHSLMPSLLRHVCTESCYKYSDSTSKTFRICRHGFYHVIHICDGCRVRRKGKYLRPNCW